MGHHSFSLRGLEPDHLHTLHFIGRLPRSSLVSGQGEWYGTFGLFLFKTGYMPIIHSSASTRIE